MRSPQSSYCAPAWLRGPHAQTLYPVLRGGPLPRYRRQRWETPDEDFIDIDCLDAPDAASAPLVVLFHGLEGSSSSHYARALIRLLAQRGWNGAVVHFRGCSGCLNRLPRAYHSGDSAEIDWVLRRMREMHRERPLYAAGVSLGGNALLKWLGEQEAAAEPVVDAAAAVCAPVDLAATGVALQHGTNRIYTRHFLQTLKRRALLRLERHPGLYRKERMLAARNLHDFDDVVTAPLHGFRDADDYWARASSLPWLPAITVPTLLLNALNDPFLPARFLPGHAQVSRFVTVEYPAEGGHVGFPAGPFPGHIDWMPARLLRFFASGC